MGFDQGAWICSKCGRRLDAGCSPDGSGRCERCMETSVLDIAGTGVGPQASGVTGEVLRRGIVARLRAYYAAAREHVDAKDSDDESHHGHLEWILGASSNPDRDDASIGVGLSELVVLWLEDLASDLEVSAGPHRTPKRPAGRRLAESRRESAARGLRAATREFADAFLTDRARTASCP